MTKDDVIRMAREAYRAYMDWADRDDPWRREHGSKYYEDEAIKKAALAAAAAERETVIAQAIEQGFVSESYAEQFRAAIRARGNT